MENKVTILVNSCDSYEDTWDPFFKLLKKYWPNLNYPIVLNTETKNYSYKGLDIRVINTQKKGLNWGGRLKNVLKQIDSEYIIFMLDDFFIGDFVDQKKIDQVVSWMDNDNNIAVFSFYEVKDKHFEDVKSDKYPGYDLRNRKGYYRYNCQAAMWRKDDLYKSLRNFESAWDWELIGNRRSRRSKKEFYAINSSKNRIFDYNYKTIGIVRGFWSLPFTKDFFDKENIKIDYSIRNSRKRKEVKENTIISKIKLYLKKIRSLV